MLSASISIQALLLILVIVVLLFGTGKLGNIGSDLGNALKGFRKALQDDSDQANRTAGDKTLKDGSEHKK
ncbi:MAG TPA: twin-arginine translocase TatA/TatE family subunit [Gammaproteobacteria bacterium]|nr:twin-arginine translocase TatA/TatE family subunit [Gammaproteobacteria bacterium]